MKKITLLFALLISSIGFSQVIVTPVYDGTFGGTSYSQTFNFPTGAENWAGFANNNISIYPLSYPNGGQVSFKASVSANAEIKFVFEKDVHPNVAPSVSTVNVTLLATNAANTVYTVAIPANATNTYKSALMYVVTRDVTVSLSEIKLIKFDTNGTTQLKVDFPIYDGIFGGSAYSQTFNFPTGAENWAGFANNNTAIYPLSFTNGGKVSFKATVATNAEIKFVFEKDIHPNVTPSVSTANVALLATNPANTSYEVAIPANATNTYKSALMYVTTRDVAVSLSEIKIHTNAPTAPPSAATYDLLESFNGTGFEGTFGGTSAAYDADPTIANTQVVKITSSASGNVWQGVNVILTSNYKLTSATQLTMQLDVYSSSVITIAPKAQAGLAGAPESVTSVNHTGSGWETLTFTFDKSLDGKAPANGDYADFALHINWNNTTNNFGTPDGRIFYIKNLRGLAVAPPVALAPTDAPATPPTYAAQNVISLYSEAYTPAAVISNVPWDDSVFEEVTIAGNKVLKIDGGNFIGMDLDKFIDATNMTHLHMDYWISTDHTAGTVLNPKLSNHGNQAGETSAIVITNIINSQDEVKKWQSKDFPLNGLRQSIKQFLITDAGKVGVYYLDNVYMYVAGTASVEDNLFSVSLYPNPASNRLNISAANTIQNAEIYNVLGKKVMSLSINKSSESIDISGLSSGVYMIKYNVDGAVGTSKFIKQ